MKILFLTSILLSCFSALACISGGNKLNDDVVLMGNGVLDLGGEGKGLISLKKLEFGKSFNIYDSKNKKTHSIIALGGQWSGAARDYISAAYLVKGLDEKESVSFIQTGVTADGYRYRGESILTRYGCN